ncbi:hypothetical protein [Maritimibacter sp. UBA3975]|uniref:hypothetical protein n=1 Tax=Maritimibacter sp. UBA3975 TaxID=1946833 RepID=UPI000C0B2811|nr:hypothetical protein [Maritimibacter sp. UBA3975]MAM63076.1 hypothetical protein [Maritimibacter sp.]|tara:strand:+ start:34903 stop:35286 length:384 start_codon:yes stop_codon:yes gene_type:complete
MPIQMRFALASAGLLFLMPLLAGILKASVFWCLAIYAIFILNAAIGAARVGREGGLMSMRGILITQGVLIVVFYLLGRFINLLAMSGDRVELTPTLYAVFVVIALAAIGAGLVASKKPANSTDAKDA